MSRHRLAIIITVVLSGTVVLAGCSSVHRPSNVHQPVYVAPHTPAAPTPTTVAPASTRTAATAVSTSVAVYDAVNGHVVSTLANPIPAGAPLTFLVASRQGAWLQVDLAQRPNGSTGWIKADSVTLHSLVYGLHVSTETKTLTLSRDGAVVEKFTVATGTGGTPTPHGSFYLTELLAPRNAGYGPYAFGLSAFSTVLNSFGGGPGQIGLHGTDDASSIGKASSHGCIRMQNADITALAKLLALGTPITID